MRIEVVFATDHFVAVGIQASEGGFGGGGGTCNTTHTMSRHVVVATLHVFTINEYVSEHYSTHAAAQ